ncbi:hypothetical protein G7K71_13680 [Desulfofundulus sp. TPOSR]|uniref:hypothetical protein n=1 Tax=Desulfofundulus sp. TPOSR TaxID=2714340 RepID=UPI00140803ED|nr:hypothetical protein [Desulfofundulus sp. TPOSR]NHM28008.1 hypothetical protein [Desulfofundulus sp. TPOSR]
MDDCDICKNNGTYLCDICCHNYEDQFEPVNDDEIKEIELKELRKRIQEELMPQKVHVKASPELLDAYNLVSRFANMEDWGLRFVAVEARESFLAATNAEILCRVDCEVPAELQDKGILELTESCAEVCRKSGWPEYESAVRYWNASPPLWHRCEFNPDFVKDIPGEDAVRLALPSKTVLLKNKYFQMVLEAFGGEKFDVFWTSNEFDPVLFVTNKIRIGVMPLVLAGLREEEGSS